MPYCFICPDTGRLLHAAHSHAGANGRPGAYCYHSYCCYLRADGSAYTYSVCGADGHPDGPADTYAYVRVNRDTGTHSHSYPNTYAHPYAYCCTDSYSDGYCYAYPYGDTYSHADHYANVYTAAYRHAHSYPDAHTTAYSHSPTHGYAETNCYTYSRSSKG